MVERIDELHPQLDLHLFAQLNVFAQTEVDVVDWIDSYFIEEERERSQVVYRRGAICGGR